ncbi:MAG: hypothetical protein ABJB40_12885, partial [Acidobacteriota bacterium]
GTDPFNPNPPDGLIRPDIVHVPAVFGVDENGDPVVDTPEAVTVTWPTLAGKQYTLLFSPDLTEGSWFPTGSPFIGDGDDHTYGFEIEEYDKRFERVAVDDVDTDADGLTDAEENELGSSPNSADGDGDGISDQDELFVHHTTPMSADSDGDSVSDWDEIMVDHTNPLLAADLDQDGMSDDLEKHWASKFLAAEPDHETWGADYESLHSGDLTPDNYYLSEHMTMRQAIAAHNNIRLFKRPYDVPYVAETEQSYCSLEGSFYPSSQTYFGVFKKGTGSGLYSLEYTSNATDFTANSVIAKCRTCDWKSAPERSASELTLQGQTGAGFFDGVLSGYTTSTDPGSSSVSHYGNAHQQRIRIAARDPSGSAYKLDYLKVTHVRAYGDVNSSGTVLSVEPVTFQIPRLDLFSDWKTFDAPEVAPGQESFVSLVSVDLDIIHPAKGELADAKEDVDDGGYVSVQRLEDPADATSDVTPKTKLKIHAVAGAQSTWKTRLKFSGADRYKIYRDEARTQEVVSEQTEFDANQDTTLFFHGLKKSLTRGGELVTMQVKVTDAWLDADSVKCTIVQSEFLIQVKAFIPYAWTEGEEIIGPELLNPMNGKVAKGDLHSLPLPRINGRPASPGFRNIYSTDAETGPSYAL